MGQDKFVFNKLILGGPGMNIMKTFTPLPPDKEMFEKMIRNAEQERQREKK